MLHTFISVITNFGSNPKVMARTITDEKIKLSIIINGDPAQKQLSDLEKSTKELTKETANLKIQRKLLEQQGKKDSEQWKELNTLIKSNTTTIDNNKATMKELQNQIGLTGLTMNQLTKRAYELKMALLNSVPGTENYKNYKAELTQVTNRISELSGKAQASKFSISSMADSFNKYQGLALSAAAGLTGIVFSIQKIIDINGKLSDSQADVMKTTGMNKKEVDELTKSFGALETRTSRIDLLKIAEQGGRIGIAKAEIGDFVNVMNKAAVALGDSFTGGAEEVSNKLGKIKFLFEETKNLGVDKAYNAIGSAINDLGANGVASEANIAEFTTRIGSLTDVLKPTIQETLALGTAFEESGIEAEVSARAYNIFMKQASTESAKFAQVMGISQKAVENMINTNPLDFMMKFAEGMRGMDATETAKTLDFLGVNADGANKVIGAMGNNMARFRELIDLSNNSFASGTSLVNEYNVKNENLAATLEKISKKVSGWFSSETFIQYLGGLVSWFGKFIGATEDADGSVTAWKNTLFFTAKIIAIVTAALLTNVAWQKLVVMWTTRNTEATLLYNVAAKARAFADGVGMIASQAFAGVMMLLRGNVLGAAQAFRVMTAAMMTTPWGFILGAIAAIGTAYVVFSEKTDKAAKSQKILSDIQADAANNIYKEKNELDALLKIANNEFETKQNRIAAIKKLNELSPEYLGNLTLENIKTAEAKASIDKYVESLKSLAYTKALSSKLEQIQGEKIDINKTSDSDLATWTDKAGALASRFMYGENQGKLALAINIKARRNELLKAKEEELKMIQDLIDADIKKNAKNYIKQDGNTTKSDFKVPAGASDKSGASSSSKKYDDSYLSDEQKRAEELFALQRKIEEQRIALMKEGYEKDLALEKLNTNSKIQEYKFQNDAIISLDNKLDKDLEQAKKDGDQKKIDSIKNQKKLLLEKQKALNELICYEEEMQNLRIGTIEEKGASNLILKNKEAYDRAKMQRETAFNEELAGLDLTNDEKKKRQEQFNQNELKLETEYLNNLLSQLDTIINSKQFEGIDLELLTPEMRDKFQKQIEEAKKLRSALQLAIQNGGEDKPNKEERNKQSGEKFNNLNGGADILGFSPDDWQMAYENLDTLNGKLLAGTMVVQALQNAWGQYNEFLNAKENAQLKNFTKSSEAKKVSLKKQLDSGMISQSYYNRHVEKLDKELEQKKFEIEYKQAKRKKAMDIVNTVVNTAVAIMQSYAQLGPIGGTIAAVLIGAMGALQIATIASTPLPAKGYEKGLYGDYVKREQDGKVFNAQYGGTTKSGVVTKPTYFLTGENGPEMIIDKRAYASLSSGTRDSLLRELRGIKGYEQGLYNQQTKRYEVPATPQEQSQAQASSGDMQMMQMMMNLMSKNIEVLEDLRDNGVFVTNKDLKSMKYLRDGIKSYEELRTKAKQ